MQRSGGAVSTKTPSRHARARSTASSAGGVKRSIGETGETVGANLGEAGGGRFGGADGDALWSSSGGGMLVWALGHGLSGAVDESLCGESVGEMLP